MVSYIPSSLQHWLALISRSQTLTFSPRVRVWLCETRLAQCAHWVSPGALGTPKPYSYEIINYIEVRGLCPSLHHEKWMVTTLLSDHHWGYYNYTRALESTYPERNTWRWSLTAGVVSVVLERESGYETIVSAQWWYGSQNLNCVDDQSSKCHCWSCRPLPY